MKTKEQFQKYNEQNPKVYELFCKFTNQVINKGFKNFSAESIINQIRWFTSIETTGNSFKINNDLKPYYARQFMKDNPQYEGFFRTRASIADQDC
jgi:hypothetical protein